MPATGEPRWGSPVYFCHSGPLPYFPEQTLKMMDGIYQSMIEHQNHGRTPVAIMITEHDYRSILAIGLWRPVDPSFKTGHRAELFGLPLLFGNITTATVNMSDFKF